MRPIHAELVKKATRMILKGESRLPEAQKPLWAEVYQKVGREDVFLLLAVLGYILKGAKREFIMRCVSEPAVNYAIPVEE